MPTYRVQVASPTVYEIEADSKQDAINQAVEQYKKERHTWIDPEILDAQELK
jgi:hypothetical protein